MGARRDVALAGEGQSLTWAPPSCAPCTRVTEGAWMFVTPTLRYTSCCRVPLSHPFALSSQPREATAVSVDCISTFDAQDPDMFSYKLQASKDHYWRYKRIKLLDANSVCHRHNQCPLAHNLPTPG
jgi:hypothetical protein